MSGQGNQSGNVNAQVQAQPKLTPSQIKWRAAVFAARGWKSKKVEQDAQALDMAMALRSFEQSVFPKGGAKQLTDAKLDPGKEFKSYLATLERFENIDPPRPRPEVEALRTAAQRYIDHYENDHSDRQRSQDKTKEKYEACRRTLLDLSRYDQVAQMRSIGLPPWNPEQQMKAAELKVTLDFEGLPDSTAEPLKNGGVNASFWFNQKDDNGQKKTYLFKPAVNKYADIEGFPRGAETVREAMAARTADFLTGVTGLNFGMPDTHVIQVDPSRFSDEALQQIGVKKQDRDKPITGSLQQFAATDGEMKHLNMARRAKIPAEDCQKIAILDTITMNMDRHAGNLMLKGGTKPRLVPIDHGLTFPPQGAVGEMSKRFGDSQNALLSIPSAHAKFSPETLEAIDKLDPDIVVQGLKTERDLLDRTHNGEGTAKIPDDALEISWRSTRFLKMGAPTLSPAAVQIALGQNAERLFAANLDRQGFEQLAAKIIKETAGQQQDWATWFTMPKEQQAAMSERLAELGWPSDRGKAQQSWLIGNMALAMRVYAADMRNPGLEAALEQKIGKQALANALVNHSLLHIDNNIKDFLPPPDPNAPPPQPLGDVSGTLRQIQAIFPRETPPPGSEAERKLISDWAEFLNMGGKQALDDAIEGLALNGIDETNARKLVDLALRVITLSRGQFDAAQEPFDGGAAELKYKQDTLNYVDTLNRLLPDSNPKKNKTRGLINKYSVQLINGRSTPSRKTLESMRTAALDRVRRDLLKDLEDYESQAKLVPDLLDQQAGMIDGWRGDIASGAVQPVRQQLNDTRQRFNIPRG